MKSNYINRLLLSKWTITIILTIAGIVVGLQLNLSGHHNNFIIFKYSYLHLVHWQNLYILYPKEHWDLYKYSPTFPLLMAPFNYIPTSLGLMIWSLMGSTSIYFAVTRLPYLSQFQKTIVFFIVLVEFITSMQNAQTNPLMVSFMVLAFICFEQKRVFWAAFFIIAATFIKVFGLAAAILFILYPQKGHFILSMLFWGLIFVIAPLIVIPLDQLVIQYQNWFHQLMEVHVGKDLGQPEMSAMGWIKSWFNVNIPAFYIQVTGLIILLLPFIKFDSYQSISFRYLVLSSILIFCVIMNHNAESPSYVIAVFGVAIWFTLAPKNALVWFLFGLAVLFTILSQTDIFPRYIRVHYALPYVFKAVPCILIWIHIHYLLLFHKNIEFAELNQLSS